VKPPLWIDRYAPTLEELAQSRLREDMQRYVDEPVNLIVHGPAGVGKTAAVRALGAATHSDAETDVIELNVADFFQRTKREIRDDPRFSRFLRGQTAFSKQYRRGGKSNRYKRQWSKRAMISHVLQELAATAPAGGSFKTIVLDNAEAIREDFQQSLRRVMEQHHQTTQFVIVTRQLTRLIAPIQSRCVPVAVSAPTDAEMTAVLERILSAEEVGVTDGATQVITAKANGDLRRALLLLQLAADQSDPIDATAVTEVLSTFNGTGTVRSVLDAAAAGDLSTARSGVETLTEEEAQTPSEVLDTLLSVAATYPEAYGEQNIIRLHQLAGEVDLRIAEGGAGVVHLMALLGAWGLGRRQIKGSIEA
jgi:replication factor C small subunit